MSHSAGGRCASAPCNRGSLDAASTAPSVWENGSWTLAFHAIVLLVHDKKDDDQLPDAEIARRMEGAIRRLLNTPPTPQKEMIGMAGAPNRGRPKRQSRPVDKGKDQV